MENYGNEVYTTINETPDGELHYIFNESDKDVRIKCDFDKVIFGGEANKNKLLIKSGDVA